MMATTLSFWLVAVRSTSLWSVGVERMVFLHSLLTALEVTVEDSGRNEKSLANVPLGTKWIGSRMLLLSLLREFKFMS